MSKLQHKSNPVTSAALASSLQASAATVSTTNSGTGVANCAISGLAWTHISDFRATTTTTIPIVTGGSGNRTATVVGDAESTVA